jgi:sirohydrochlorin cobaltochelatase
MPNVLVVPFFIADGLHSFQDIPVLLGIESEITAAASQGGVFRQNPVHLRGRSLYYSRSIGTDPSLADVILDQVSDFRSSAA